jgi:hypothetical protein
MRKFPGSGRLLLLVAEAVVAVVAVLSLLLVVVAVLVVVMVVVAAVVNLVSNAPVSQLLTVTLNCLIPIPMIQNCHGLSLRRRDTVSFLLSQKNSHRFNLFSQNIPATCLEANGRSKKW